MKLCLYSPVLMDARPFRPGDLKWNVTLAQSWARYDMLIIGLGAMHRNPWLLPLLREHCPKATIVGYFDAFTSCPWLEGAAGEAAMAAEPYSMTTRQRRVGQDFNAIVGEHRGYIDITVPGVATALLQLWIDMLVKVDVGAFVDSAHATCPFEATAAKSAAWNNRARFMFNVLRGICRGSRPMIINPSWHEQTNGHFSERWDELELVDPIGSFLDSPGKHTHDVVFTGFDPQLGWPGQVELEHRIQYGMACASILDAYFCTGPSDLFWLEHPEREYWRWADEPWWQAFKGVGQPLGKPWRSGSRWMRSHEQGLVWANVVDKTAGVE